MSLETYKWIVKETNIAHLKQNNQLEDKKVVTIAIKNLSSGIIIPHPITHFIRQKYQFPGKSLNSQLNPAREITKFLNFLNKKISEGNPVFLNLNSKGLNGLDTIHGSHYITYCTEKGLTYKYIKNSIERYLIKFYEYLNDLNILDKSIEFEYVLNRQGLESIISPFAHPTLDTQYPPTTVAPKKKLKDFGDNSAKRNKLVYEFLEEARRVSPEIVLGIALQIFGGLRRGEVVNLTVSSFPADFLQGSNHISVLDNQDKLFTQLKNTTKEQVKRPRIQPILPSDYLRELYLDHSEYIERINKDNLYAFFVDDKGKTISGRNYEVKFSKVKYSFIDRLAESTGRYLDYLMLYENIWGTHIGRGLFTNYLYDMGLDERQMAIARGDKSTQSAAAYIDYKSAISNFQTAMEFFSTEEILNVEGEIRKRWNWREL